jgi:hypothetical protein
MVFAHICSFSEKFGVLETVELKEGGSSISVTNENKVEYVKLLSEHRLRNSVRKQMQVNLNRVGFCFILVTYMLLRNSWLVFTN